MDIAPSLSALAVDPYFTWLGIALATLVSEDLTCIATGLLIREASLGPTTGVVSCLLGIYVGDLGLWLLGRVLGRRLFRMRWIASRLPLYRVQKLGKWFDERGWSVILASRFLPGSRLPLYVAAGMLGRRAGYFAFWSFAAALLWTPLLVLGVAALGPGIVRPLEAVLGKSWAAIGVAGIIFYASVRLGSRLSTQEGRGRLKVTIERMRRYEFWPAWLFYLPLLPYLVLLAIRYRGVATLTTANPGIPHGGVVGESKYEILSRLPRQWIIPSALIPPGDLASRCQRLASEMQRLNWCFPLILKPDASQRGAGVKRVDDLAAARAYFELQPAPVLTQTYDPGPFEAGIFYYRIPGQQSGRIFSITDKVFPTLTGDGRRTLEELITRHPRFRLQTDIFLARHGHQANRVLTRGERLPLTLAGNHCQGTMFRDGAHLWTPELERTVDFICRQFEGFFIGRFDVRYNDVERFRAGRDLGIVELNGVTSESTNLYDPAWSLWRAYRTLARQWGLIFKIGHLNRLYGHRPTPFAELVRCVRAYYRDRRLPLLAD